MGRFNNRLFFVAAGLLLFLISCISGPWQPKRPSSHSAVVTERCNPYKTDIQMIKLPVFSQTWQIVEDCDKYPSEAVAIAMIFFYNDWTIHFGDDRGMIWRTLNSLLVEWVDRERLVSGHDITGRLQQRAKASGITLTKSMVWVRPSLEGPICETSFIHELVHVAIWSIKGTDGDPDHLGTKYLGWTVDHSALIQRVNDQLCALGI
jgi:hypothetical protein